VEHVPGLTPQANQAEWGGGWSGRPGKRTLESAPGGWLFARRMVAGTCGCTEEGWASSCMLLMVAGPARDTTAVTSKRPITDVFGDE
jgi:hypothetical protein